MADEPAPPSVASHTSVLSNILSAIMHLIAVSPNAPSAASAAVHAAHMEMARWNPPPETPPAPPEVWQGNAPDAATGISLPNPNQPITEATGDGPPDAGDQPISGVASPANPMGQQLDGSPQPEDMPEHPPAG